MRLAVLLFILVLVMFAAPIWYFWDWLAVFVMGQTNLMEGFLKAFGIIGGVVCCRGCPVEGVILHTNAACRGQWANHPRFGRRIRLPRLAGQTLREDFPERPGHRCGRRPFAGRENPGLGTGLCGHGHRDHSTRVRH